MAGEFKIQSGCIAFATPDHLKRNDDADPKLVPGWRRIAVAGVLSLGLATTAHAATAVPLDIPGAGRSADIDEAYGFDGGLLGGGWRHQRSYGYQGPAGVYSCEQGQIGSNLNRKACGGQKFPNRFF